VDSVSSFHMKAKWRSTTTGAAAAAAPTALAAPAPDAAAAPAPAAPAAPAAPSPPPPPPPPPACCGGGNLPGVLPASSHSTPGAHDAFRKPVRRAPQKTHQLARVSRYAGAEWSQGEHTGAQGCVWHDRHLEGTGMDGIPCMVSGSTCNWHTCMSHARPLVGCTRVCLPYQLGFRLHYTTGRLECTSYVPAVVGRTVQYVHTHTHARTVTLA
jgi:hypothetical protein